MATIGPAASITHRAYSGNSTCNRDQAGSENPFISPIRTGRLVWIRNHIAVSVLDMNAVSLKMFICRSISRFVPIGVPSNMFDNYRLTGSYGPPDINNVAVRGRNY